MSLTWSTEFKLWSIILLKSIPQIFRLIIDTYISISLWSLVLIIKSDNYLCSFSLIFCKTFGKSFSWRLRFLNNIIHILVYVVGPASARSYKIRVVGNNWLVGNAVFSETALRIFLIFCMKLGDYKGRKVTEPDFWKKFLIWRYSRKGLQISPKSDTLIFFSKTALTIFLVFGLKLVLNMTFNLNETYFSEKFAIWRYLTSKSSKNCPNWGFWPFSRLCIISFPWFCT